MFLFFLRNSDWWSGNTPNFVRRAGDRNLHLYFFFLIQRKFFIFVKHSVCYKIIIEKKNLLAESREKWESSI